MLAAKGFELLLDLGAWQLGLLQILDRAALCIEPVAVARDELALREVAIDETAGVDRRRAIGITAALVAIAAEDEHRSEEHTSELQSLMRISYAVFCLKKKTNKNKNTQSIRYRL